MPGMRKKVYLITGPTAVGKTSAAVVVAQRIGAEIISADSRQVYIGMDIGTAKPTDAQRKAVRHHLVDIVRPDEDFNAAIFAQIASEAFDDIHSRGGTAIVVGGTGLYIKALLKGYTFKGVGADENIREAIEIDIAERGIDAVYAELKELDPAACEKIHPNNIPRVVRALEVIKSTGRPFSEISDDSSGDENPAYEYVAVCINTERGALYRRIDRRVEGMVHAGWPREVKELLSRGYTCELRALNALGYREIADYVEKRWSFREAIDAICKATRNFAQRQLTFFRGMPELKWMDVDPMMGIDDVASVLADELGLE